MEAVVRKPFQGVTNIIRFNWHFYIIACLLVLFLFASLWFLPADLYWLVNSAALIICFTTLFSLLVSYYVYDHSGLYNLHWLNELNITPGKSIINIHAGFDETSGILTNRYPHADITVFDFYDPQKHTEISIERARKAYAPYSAAIKISTAHIPLNESSADLIFNIFAVHEIRNKQERVNFLRKQAEVLRTGGKCIVVEHLRDIPNFFAYNIGFLHFYSVREWNSNFSLAGFSVEKTKKITPFVTVFILKKTHGDTH
jgi:hypothetical protein